MTTSGTDRGTPGCRVDDPLAGGSAAVVAVLGLALGCGAAALLGACLGGGWWQALAVVAGLAPGALAAGRPGFPAAAG